MWFVFLIVALFVLIPVEPSLGASRRTEMTLCEALSSIRAGEPMEVTLSGIYRVSIESAVLYDPDQPACPENVQPATWIKFSLENSRIPKDELLRVLKESSGEDEFVSRAYVRFRGVLHGPGRVGPDDPAVETLVAFANRTSHYERYGHASAFRTMLVVKDILAVSRVPESVPDTINWVRKSPDPDLAVSVAEVPVYPSRALAVGITGSVKVELVIDDGEVAEARLLEGDRLLGEEALRNVKTWRFKPGTSAIVETIFIYDLERRQAGDEAPRISLKLPYSVKITAARDEW